jgi:excisionase family DNA binding protein
MRTDEELLRVDEVAARLRCSRASVYRRVADGQLGAFRLGATGPLRIARGDVEALLRPVRTTTREVR